MIKPVCASPLFWSFAWRTQAKICATKFLAALEEDNSLFNKTLTISSAFKKSYVHEDFVFIPPFKKKESTSNNFLFPKKNENVLFKKLKFHISSLNF